MLPEQPLQILLQAVVPPGAQFPLEAFCVQVMLLALNCKFQIKSIIAPARHIADDCRRFLVNMFMSPVIVGVPNKRNARSSEAIASVLIDCKEALRRCKGLFSGFLPGLVLEEGQRRLRIRIFF
jgi:hypothetical protein